MQSRKNRQDIGEVRAGRWTAPETLRQGRGWRWARRVLSGSLLFVLQCVLYGTVVGGAAHVQAEPLPVRHLQGTAHGFLSLTTLDGRRIGTGDVTQVVYGGLVTARLTFHFRDGSLDDDTTVFTQHGRFRLVTDHHIQRGPSFAKESDVLIDAVHGRVTTRSKDGTLVQDEMEIPSDAANGLLLTLMLNLAPTTPETVVSYVTPTTKPSLMHLSIKPDAALGFKVGGGTRQAAGYVIHVQLGGVKGVIAPLIGKQPLDTHVWILDGAAPAFIREEGQMFEGGPVWRIEQISPAFAD